MKSFFQKTLALALITALLSFAVPKPASAGYWGEDLLAAEYKEILEEIYLQIKETIIANLKTVAIQTIQSQLSSLLGSSGPGGGSLVISNWQNFIYSSASRYSTQVTNDFFSSLKSGTPSALTQRIITPAEKAVASTTNIDDFAKIRPDLQNYVSEGRAENIFNPGAAQDFSAAWIVAGLTQNDMADTYLRAKQLKEEKARQKEGEKTAEGVAGAGYESVKSKTTSPSTSGGYTAYSKDGSPYTVPPGSGGYTAYSKDGSPYTVPPGSGGYTAYSKDGSPYTVPSSTVSSSDFGEDPLAGTSVEEIMTPGSTIADTNVKGKTLSMDMLAMARSIPEVATAMVTSMLTQMMNKGISTVTSKVSGQLGGSGEIGSALSGISSGLSSTAASAGGKAIKTTTGKLQNMIQSGLK